MRFLLQVTGTWHGRNQRGLQQILGLEMRLEWRTQDRHLKLRGPAIKTSHGYNIGLPEDPKKEYCAMQRVSETNVFDRQHET